MLGRGKGKDREFKVIFSYIGYFLEYGKTCPIGEEGGAGRKRERQRETEMA